jgi:Tol biopolymer transport system component
MLGAAVLVAAAAGAVWVHASGDIAPSDTAGAGSAEHRFGAWPSVSDDGRWVVYEGAPPVEDGRRSSVWLVDRAAPESSSPVEITAADQRIRPGDSVRPVISGDGCVVVVVTQLAYDLFRDDDRGDRWDVYRRVLPHCDGDGDWELVSSTTAEGSSAVAGDVAVPDERPAVSVSGAIVAYTHRSEVDLQSLRQVSVVDLTLPAGDPERVLPVPGFPSFVADNGFVHRGQFHPDLSADGRIVVFAADAAPGPEAPQWADGMIEGGPATSQVYRWDRDSSDPLSAVRPISTVDGVLAVGGATGPVVSADGRFIAFESSSPDLVAAGSAEPCGDNCATQVVRVDTRTGDVALVSKRSIVDPNRPGQELTSNPSSGAWAPSISADGRLVAFVTRDRSLFAVRSDAGSDPADGDIVVADLERNVLTRVSTTSDRTGPLTATNANPALSATGHVVVFDTLAGPQLPTQSVLSGAATGGGRHAVVVDRQARLVPASLDVGTVRVGIPGAEWYVSVRNEGPSTFVPAEVVSTDPRFAVTGGTCGLGVAVGAGESCTVYVTLTPDTVGPVSASIIVSDRLHAGSSAAIAVSGAGGEPALDPTPAGADFVATLVGEVARPLAFDIANIGFVPDAIVSIGLGGPHPEDFAVSSTSCSGVLLYPTTSCAVEVQFRPVDAGYRAAVLTLTSSAGSTTSIILSGIGTRIVTLEAVDRQVRPGTPLAVVGSGFPAGALVSVSWADGRGEVVTVTAGPNGAFLASIPTRMSDRPGERTLVAVGADLSAETTVKILRRRVSSPFGT